MPECPPHRRPKVRAYERAYNELDRGDFNDRLEGLWDEKDPITERLLVATPRTLVAAPALAAVWFVQMQREIDPGDDVMVCVANTGLGTLDDAERLARGGVS